MSIWGKVIGGFAGLALGGPLGALLGAVAGHAVDRMRAKTGPEDLNAAKKVAFTVAVIALGAKMAKADGVVTRAEVDAFKQLFRVPPDEMKGVAKIFDEAKREATGFEAYAEQVARMFVHEPAVLEELLGGLFHIAKADGVIHEKELSFLRRVATIFGFTAADFERIRQTHLPPEEADPFEVLGVAHDADDQQIKTVYRRLVRENHPDKLMAEGMPQEFIDLANEKLAAINAAYEVIKKRRGIS
ncbi:MAG: TerB family tellurite resistance protein [Rhodospirillales bacterium]|nr:TerB family tellurite resistance protein [Rhodospirillales bacterium]